MAHRTGLRRAFVALAIVAACAFAIGVLAAQDRFTLKSANGIAFSEFKGYESWQVIASSQADAGDGCGTSPDPGCIKSIVGNPVMIKAYSDGMPANGKPVPDGAMMAKIEWAKSRNTSAPYRVTVPGPLAEISFMVKDSKRFPDTNGWGYAKLKYNAATATFTPLKIEPSETRTTCHECHIRGAKARDFVYTSYALR